MSRDDGFAIMDVSTTVHRDAKFKRLARAHPRLVGACFTAYMALLGESWLDGSRVLIEDAWPSILPYSEPAVAALREFNLIDADGRIKDESWGHWFTPALKRRTQSRERWARANANRHSDVPGRGTSDVPAPLPRGDLAGTSATVRPSVRPSVPTGNDGLPHITEAVAVAWESVSGRSVLASGNWPSRMLDELCERKGEAVVIARLPAVRATFNGTIPSPSQLAAALRDDLEPFRTAKEANAEEREAHERDRGRKAVAATKTRIHRLGAHEETPDPRCPLCQP